MAQCLKEAVDESYVTKMVGKMSDLIERARLMDEEIKSACSPPWDSRRLETGLKGVADAQLRKALFTVLEWLDEHRIIADEASADCARLFEELHPHVSSRGRYREAFKL